MFQSRGARACAPIVVTLALAFASGPAWSQANNAQVDQAKQLIGEERFVEALAAAKDAARADPADYRARYYVAMSYMGLRQFDQAEAEATAAEAQAPESAKAAVQKLTATIRGLRQGVSDVTEAEAALNEGLIGKAARLYEAAWNAGRNAPDHGLKAAQLYSTRLSQPVDAARVLRQVKQALPNSAAADSAEAELKVLAPKLREIATGYVTEARALPLAQALPKLQAAEAADPSYSTIFLVRAQLAGAAGASDLVQAAIKELARRNLITIERLAAIPNLRTMLATPDFATFMADVIGSEQAAALTRAVSPEGQVDFLTRVAQQGQLQLFIGRRNDGAGRFQSYARRKVTALQGLQGCTSVILLGDTVAASPDVVAGLPSRIIDWRQVDAPAVSADFVGFGPMFDGWEATGFNVVGDGAPIQRVVEAIRVIRDACPPPPPPAKRR
ncbi:MAG: hypothetical protein KKE02_01625 [Alphaproteobacteria bacterium]|nr:hypothetical protein [Alphaproteobacteria bacterium]MBU1516144.1 hypothetical protein [Alphaproteobacteria bacterium]MBU2092641.1 hypothetical protein [Alphaproteobacteria bacterium]MBU2149690.1 hypothetical protein [Alphaproteobacteria bacterium]MBU2308462.1 hypothetical protein [Alphaproteobacteria bacterium]